MPLLLHQHAVVPFGFRRQVSRLPQGSVSSEPPPPSEVINCAPIWRTQSYARMLKHAFVTFGTTPDRVTRQDVFGWAHGIGLSGRTASRVTVGARIACLSSFFRFLIRMELVSSNPCDA